MGRIKPQGLFGVSTESAGTFGFELFLAQSGQHPPSGKTLKGLAAGAVELVEDFDTDTYRAVHSALREGHIRPSLLQEEVEERYQDIAE